MQKRYSVSFEISGPTAMWTRPDTGDSPVSYPAPAYSAVKGLFESVAFLKTVEVVPARVEICSPVVYHGYATNYGGPLRKPNTTTFQVYATVLINVCYRLYADLQPAALDERQARDPRWSERALAKAALRENSLHAYQEIFERRLRRGQWHDIPFLGLREFVPSYIGPFRSETRVCELVDLVLPSMLHRVFDRAGVLRPSFRQGVAIRKGVLEYAE